MNLEGPMQEHCFLKIFNASICKRRNGKAKNEILAFKADTRLVIADEDRIGKIWFNLFIGWVVINNLDGISCN